MKKQLLKKLMMTAVFFAVVTMSAQQGPVLYDFSANAQGWVKGFGPGVVAHDATGGVSGDGALTLSRAGNNNANIRRGQGGVSTFIVLDRSLYNFIKIVYKNETAATSFRIQGQSRPGGTTDAPANFPQIVAGGIDVQGTDFSTLYVDVSAIPAGHEVTRIDILARTAAASDPAGSLVVFDEIEFLNVTNTFGPNNILQNPSFDDSPFSVPGWSTPGNRPFVEFSVGSDAFDGSQSALIKYVADEPASGNNYFVENVQNTLPALQAMNNLKASMRVKLVRPANSAGNGVPLGIKIQGNFLIDGDDASTPQVKTKVANTTTDTALDTWHLVEFNINDVPQGDIDELIFRFNIQANGYSQYDEIYVDDVRACVNCATLSAKDVIKDDASVRLFPNPASTVLNIEASDRTISKIEVYSILGKKVLSAENTKSINVSTLSRGVYISKIYGDNSSVSTKRFVKQ